MDSPSPDTPTSLNARRNKYVRRMRRLIERFKGHHPNGLKGILGRAGSVLDAQLPSLDALGGLDLEGPGPDVGPTDVVEALVRAQHLPRMILAFDRVLREEKKQSGASLLDEALELARDLALITHDWVLLHEKELDELEED